MNMRTPHSLVMAATSTTENLELIDKKIRKIDKFAFHVEHDHGLRP